MGTKRPVSIQTRNNWFIDASLFASAVLAAVSGIYFLIFPVGGYQGGRNPWYNVQILFDRHTWDDIHMWGGIMMILVAALHIVIHWRWIVNMTRRTVKELAGKCGPLNSRARFNLWINLCIALSFLLTAISGIYFLLWPGEAGGAAPQVILNRSAWDILHTWASVVLILSAAVHFVIHWKWVTKVTRSLFPRVAAILLVAPSTE